jgi:hypothetical protein
MTHGFVELSQCTSIIGYKLKIKSDCVNRWLLAKSGLYPNGRNILLNEEMMMNYFRIYSQREKIIFH